MQSLTLVWVNPGVWLFWALIGGPIFLRGWAQSPLYAIAFTVGMYGVFLPLLTIITILIEKAGAINPQANRIMLLIASITMAGLALYQIGTGLRG